MEKVRLVTKQSGLFGKVIKALKSALQKRRAYKKARRQLFKILTTNLLQNGRFTAERVMELEGFMAQNNLPVKVLKNLKHSIYSAALEAMKKDKKITEVEELDLERLKKFLGLKESEIAHARPEISRLRLLAEIERGNIQSYNPPNVILQRGEKAFWGADAIWKEERISRRYEGGSRGVSIRIVKGVNYRVGASKGRLAESVAIASIAEGELVVTSKRLIFAGLSRSFQIPYAKIINLEFYSDGLVVNTGVGKTKWIMLNKGESDIIEALLIHAVNANY